MWVRVWVCVGVHVCVCVYVCLFVYVPSSVVQLFRAEECQRAGVWRGYGQQAAVQPTSAQLFRFFGKQDSAGLCIDFNHHSMPCFTDHVIQ